MMNIHQFQVSLAPANESISNDGYDYDPSGASNPSLFQNNDLSTQSSYPAYQQPFNGQLQQPPAGTSAPVPAPQTVMQTPNDTVTFTPDLVQNQITSQFNQFHLQTPITQSSPNFQSPGFQSPVTGKFQNSFPVLQTPNSANSISSHHNLAGYPQEVLSFDNSHSGAILTSPINFDQGPNLDKKDYQMFPIAEQSPVLPKANKAKGKILRIPSSASIKKSSSQLKLNAANLTPKAKLKVKKSGNTRSKDNLLHDEIEEILKTRTDNSNSNSSDSSSPSKDAAEANMSDFGINIDDLLKYDPFVDLTTSPADSNISSSNTTVANDQDDSLVSHFINFETHDGPKPEITGLGVSYEYTNNDDDDLSPSTLTDLNSTTLSSPILDPSLSTSPTSDRNESSYNYNDHENIIVSKNTKNSKKPNNLSTPSLSKSATIPKVSTFPNRVLKKAQSFTNGINSINNSNNNGTISTVSTNTKKRSVSSYISNTTSTFSLEDCCNEIALAPVNNYSFVYENATGDDANTKSRRGSLPTRPNLRKAFTASNTFINSGPSTGTSSTINSSSNKNISHEAIETSKSLKDMESGMVSFQVQIKKWQKCLSKANAEQNWRLSLYCRISTFHICILISVYGLV